MSDDSDYTLDIPTSLRRARPSYLDLPVSEWPVIPLPAKRPLFHARQTAGVCAIAPKAPAGQPITTSEQPDGRAPDTKPHRKRRPLRGAARDRAALDIVAAVKDGSRTFQALRKRFAAWDTVTIRSAIRRALALHLLELEPGTRSYQPRSQGKPRQK